MPLTRARTMEIVTATLAAETGWRPSDVPPDAVRVVEIAPDRAGNPLRRRFPPSSPEFKALATGAGCVAAATREWLEPAGRAWTDCPPVSLFEPWRMAVISGLARSAGALLHGPFPRFVGVADDLIDAPPPPGYRLKTLPPGEAGEIDPQIWPNNVRHTNVAERPTHAIAIALHGSETAGVASIGADSDLLWGIGVDVLPAHRGRGLATALTVALARYAIERDAVPYYSAAMPNIPSLRTAAASGLTLAWVEAFTRPESPARASSIVAGG